MKERYNFYRFLIDGNPNNKDITSCELISNLMYLTLATTLPSFMSIGPLFHQLLVASEPIFS